MRVTLKNERGFSLAQHNLLINEMTEITFVKHKKSKNKNNISLFLSFFFTTVHAKKKRDVPFQARQGSEKACPDHLIE